MPIKPVSYQGSVQGAQAEHRDAVGVVGQAAGDFPRLLECATLQYYQRQVCGTGMLPCSGYFLRPIPVKCTHISWIVVWVAVCGIAAS